MKTKILLRQGGVKNHPLWHIIVQADKKNLKGKYIERVGYWMPRNQKSYKRGMVLNMHKVRYWLSVGAQPSGGVIRVLNRFGLYPKSPVPFGKDTLYEKPLKQYKLNNWKDGWKTTRNQKWHFYQMIQEQINIVERQKRVQAEAIANLGQGNEVTLDEMKTDDIGSEEADVFERKKKFDELNKRFEKHRKEQWKLKGNDLRYNIYMNKMQKLVRMDVGLDVEGYKDYVNNLKVFAQHNQDWQILAEDNMAPVAGTALGPLDTFSSASKSGFIKPDLAKQMKEMTMKDKLKQLRNTVGKLFRSHYGRILEKDLNIVKEFEEDPTSFMDLSIDLQVDLKRLYDQRKLQIEERNQMNTYHIESITDKDLDRAGVTKREFNLIKKMMKIDPAIFTAKEHKESSPFTYTVDLSKYDNTKIPQDCKEILFRPQKMRKLYERYWQIASQKDKEAAQQKNVEKHLRWKAFHTKMEKGNEEYLLMDRIVAAIEKGIDIQKQEQDAEKKQMLERYKELYNTTFSSSDGEKIKEINKKEIDTLIRSPPRTFFQDAFEYQADKIMTQIKKDKFVTKTQLKFMAEYAKVFKIERNYFLDEDMLDGTFYIEDMAPMVQKDEVTWNDILEDQELIEQNQEVEGSNEMDDNQMKQQKKEIKEEQEKQEKEAYLAEQKKAIEESGLSEEIFLKFQALADPLLDFKAKSDLLQWFVDSLCTSVINHFEQTGTLPKMDLQEREKLISDLETLQKECREQLFQMHKDKKEGKLIEPDSYLYKIKVASDILNDQLCMAQSYHNSLKKIEEHNNQLDLFEMPYDARKAFLEELNGLLDDGRVTGLPGSDQENDSDMQEFEEMGGLEVAEQLHNEIDQYLNRHRNKRQRRGDRGEDGEDDVVSVEAAGVGEDADDLAASQAIYSSDDPEILDIIKEGLDFDDGLSKKPEDTTDIEDYDIFRKLKNIQLMDPKEANELVEEINKYHTIQNGIDIEKDHKDYLMEKLTQQIYYVNRFGLDYKKLYHDFEGGYDLKQLTKVLERIRSDHKQGLHPFIDADADEKLMDNLERVLKIRVEKAKAQKDNAEEEQAEEEDEEGEKPKSIEDELLEDMSDEEEKEEMRELLKMVAEKQEREASEDLREWEAHKKDMKKLGYDSDDIQELEHRSKDIITDEEYFQLQELMKQETGYHLDQIEDEEEFKQAWIEWVQDKLPRRKQKKLQPDVAQKIEERLKREHPELAMIFERLKRDNYPKSLVTGEFFPSRKEREKELDRIESNIGRYPVGFRHYENWQNYTSMYPDATLEDYRDDLNSQISFDEYLLLNKKAFLYECKHNPTVIYKFQLDRREDDQGDSDGENYDDMRASSRPDRIVETEGFKQMVANEYASQCQHALVNKQWFKKVDAMELFTDYWTYGRSLASMPTHNVYVPVTTNIMPRPRFRDYSKNDQNANDFTFRDRDSMAPDYFTTKMTSTLKPHPFSPKLKPDDNAQSRLQYEQLIEPKKKFKRIRRLSKNADQRHKSIQFATKWQFSTVINAKTQQEEAREIEKFERQTRLTEGLSMVSKLDTSPYSLWGAFAQQFIGKKK